MFWIPACAGMTVAAVGNRQIIPPLTEITCPEI
jgi:hypothetical protein